MHVHECHVQNLNLDGTGYADDGREIFDDDLDEPADG